MNAEDLVRRQRFGLWLDGRPGLHNADEAEAFLAEVGVAMRYGATDSLPLASLYRATQRHTPETEDEKAAHARAFDLTNELLACGDGVEITVVAGRVGLAHARLMPAIYALRRNGREPELSPDARSAFDLISAELGASAGDVRRHLGAVGQPRPDAADVALGELQRDLVVDRGPSSTPKQGIFYLSKEGYPYRVFAVAHPDVLAAAGKLDRGQAADRLLSAHLAAAVFAAPGKLATMFRELLTREEIDGWLSSAGLDRARVGRSEVFVRR